MNNFSKWIVQCVALVALGVAGFAGAEEQRLVTVSASARFAGQVERSFVVLANAARVVAVAPATYVASSDERDGAVVGRVPVTDADSALQLLFVLIGAKGEVWSTYREARIEELSAATGLKTSELRSRFVERRGVLRNLQASIAAQDGRLADLEADADAIANVNRIVSAEDELGSVRSSIARVASAQAGINERLQRMKSRAEPSNAKKREAELVGQLGELSTALSVKEASSIKKISSATTDLQQKIRLIEETREDQIDLLEQELAELRRKRQKSGKP